MANRYTNLTPSAYTPLTLEEIALVPAMKRKQHDELAKQLAEAAVKVDPLKEHEAEGLRLKNEMEGKVATLSEQLASEGISPDATTKFYTLNKEYRDLTGPMGRVGKINAAKVAEAEAKKKFFEMNSKYYGSADLQRNWDAFRKKYTGFDDTQADLPQSQKDIVNIGDLGAPKYVDRDAVIKDVIGTTGHQIRTQLQNEGAKLVNIGGVLALRSLDGKRVIKTNNKELQASLDALNQRVAEGQDLRQSQDFQNISKADDLRYIASRIQAANIYEEQKDLKESIDVLPAGVGPDAGGGADVINTRQDPHTEIAKMGFKERVDTEKKLKTLIDSGKGTLDDRRNYALYKAHNAKVNESLKDDKVYQDLRKEYEKEKNAFLKTVPNKAWGESIVDEDYTVYKLGAKDGYADQVEIKGKRLSVADSRKFMKSMAQYKYGKQDAKKRVSDYIESIDDKTNYYSQHYGVLETSGTEAAKSSNAIASKLGDIFQGLSPTVIQSAQGIGRVKGSNGKWIPVNEEEDVEGVSNLLAKYADPATIKLVDFSSMGAKGSPTVSVSFKTDKDTESYNLEGWGAGKGNIGAGETVTLELDLGAFSSIPAGDDTLGGTMNILGAAIAHFEQYGGEKGAKFAEEARQSIQGLSK